MQIIDRLHTATGGVFDPTIQPLWQAYARGGDIDAACIADLPEFESILLLTRTGETHVLQG